MKLKALITAAAPSQRHILHQTLATHDNRRPTIAEFLLDLITPFASEIAIVVAKGDSQRFQRLSESGSHPITIIEQPSPNGYVDAILQAKEFLGEHPFLHMVGDHFYLGGAEGSVGLVRQLVDAYAIHQCSLSAVQATPESMLPYFGAVGGAPITTGNLTATKLYQISRILEKPTPTQAEQELVVPGLRQGHYLCFFGLHLFTPSLLHILTTMAGEQTKPQLAEALQRLAKRERYLAMTLPGRRFDIGRKYGLLQAQLALGLQGKDREEILALMLELTAK